MNKHSLTPEEYFKYVCQDEDAKFYFEMKCNVLGEYLKNHIEGIVEKEVESLSEQISFAQQTLEEIEAVLDRSTRLSEFKKSFRSILDESYFER